VCVYIALCTCLSESVVNEKTPQVPSFPYMCERLILASLSYISFSVPGQISLSPGSSRITPIETDDPFPEFSFFCLSISLDLRAPFMFPASSLRRETFSF